MLNLDVLTEHHCTLIEHQGNYEREVTIQNNLSCIVLTDPKYHCPKIKIEVVGEPIDITNIIRWLGLKPFTYRLHLCNINTYIQYLHGVNVSGDPMVYSGGTYKSIYETGYINILHDKIKKFRGKPKIVIMPFVHRWRPSDIPDDIEIVIGTDNSGMYPIRGIPSSKIKYNEFKKWLIELVINDFVEMNPSMIKKALRLRSCPQTALHQ